MSKDTLCKHDWVGDDECAYCKCAELEGLLKMHDNAEHYDALIITEKHIAELEEKVKCADRYGSQNRALVNDNALLRRQLTDARDWLKVIRNYYGISAWEAYENRLKEIDK